VSDVVVRFASDRHRPPFDLEIGFRSRGFHHLHALGHDLEPDVVAFENADLERH
jgi:hypothetical protein